MRPRLTTCVTLRGLCSLLVLQFGLGLMQVEAADAPEHVRDLKYGSALYPLYQGQTFDALSAFSVAQQRGGIAGHGDYPALVEGGLMLEYGLLREAKVRFEALLTDPDDARVAPGVRNQAWFYLGKVFYLEQDLNGARAALNRVKGEQLQQDQPELFEEWHYLNGRIVQQSDSSGTTAVVQINALPEGNLWRAYLSYNEAVQAPDEHASHQLQALIDQLRRTEDPADATERQALIEQCLLTLGQWRLQQGQSEQALENFKQIRPDSVFSAQARYGYAIAAANLQQFDLALEVLASLQDRPSFTSDLQPVSYALGYVYEHLQQPALALSAYQAASEHYRQVAAQLEQAQVELTEHKIIGALALRESSIGAPSSLRQSVPVRLGDPTLVSDAYGRLPLAPTDFSVAKLLVTESFQVTLRDLHELYQLQSALVRWAQQLDSFEAMVATREQQRRQRLTETEAAIEAQQADQWLDQQQSLIEQIETARVTENLAFFSDAEQLAASQRLQGALEKWQLLPEGPEKTEFSVRIERLRAYLEWWLADSYAVNRWQAEKQLRELSGAVDEFKQRRAKLAHEFTSNEQNAQLARRVEQGRARLQSVSTELEQSLASVRQQLLDQVRTELVAQRVEAKGYLLAAQQAQARLSDELYRVGLSSATAIPGLTLDQVMASYFALLPLLEDPATKDQVLHRLADLQLAKAEAQLAEQGGDDLAAAITAYQNLLHQAPDRPDNDQVLYQLAKSYDLQGQTDAQLRTLEQLVQRYPNSDYWVEAQYRRAELLFSASDYAAAQQAFDGVINRGTSVFLANAHYLRGWCLFKQQQFALALLSFTQVLDLVSPTDPLLPEADDIQVAPQHRRMVDDLLRVMGLSFSYLDGADSVAKLFAEVGPKSYEPQIYQRYGELLREQAHFSDGLAVYRRFIELHPQSLWAPRYQVKVLEILHQADFKRDILAEKQRFVEVYGKGSAFWSQHNSEQLAFVREQLRTLLPELADLAYLQAQKQLTGAEDAVKYNAAFVDTFPADPEAPQRWLLLGESYLLLSDWPQAIVALERAGYDDEDFPKSSEAAYAALLAYEEYAKTWLKEASEVRLQLQAQQQQSRLRFVARHEHDPRAVSVLALVMTEAFGQKNYQETLARAQQLLDRQPLPEPKIRLEAQLLSAHSRYALGDFAQAETAYQAALAVLPEADPRQQSIVENLAASVFRQAQARLAAGQKELAIDELLRMATVAPSSRIRPVAEYDAASYLLELRQWPRAIEVLSSFRQRYPQHELTPSVSAKLALAYRETEQWAYAAQELERSQAQTKDPTEQQETQLLIAEFYDKAQNLPQALAHYRRYAQAYPQPAERYVEVANRLAELYELSAQPEQQRFWLHKQMTAVDQASNQADERMRYLAARAAAVLANDAYVKYQQIQLKQPLTKTMAAKTKALEQTLKAYQKTAGYSVAEFSTEAGYRMAQSYAQLSVALMASDRPAELNELEAEQYDLLLEEQAYPFEERAIELHQQNAQLSWQGIYDAWVKRSFDALQTLLPGRYRKVEQMAEVVDEL